MKGAFGKRAVFLVLIAVLFAMTIGGVYTAEMMTMDGGTMHNCPFMGVPALCDMSPIAHLSLWQQMFTTIVQQVAIAAFLLLLAAAVAWHFVRYLYVPKRIEIRVPRHMRDAEHGFNPLRLAFARGIIHSKVF